MKHVRQTETVQLPSELTLVIKGSKAEALMLLVGHPTLKRCCSSLSLCFGLHCNRRPAFALGGRLERHQESKSYNMHPSVSACPPSM